MKRSLLMAVSIGSLLVPAVNALAQDQNPDGQERRRPEQSQERRSDRRDGDAGAQAQAQPQPVQRPRQEERRQAPAGGGQQGGGQQQDDRGGRGNGGGQPSGGYNPDGSRAGGDRGSGGQRSGGNGGWQGGNDRDREPTQAPQNRNGNGGWNGNGGRPGDWNGNRGGETRNDPRQNDGRNGGWNGNGGRSGDWNGNRGGETRTDPRQNDGRNGGWNGNGGRSGDWNNGRGGRDDRRADERRRAQDQLRRSNWDSNRWRNTFSRNHRSDWWRGSSWFRGYNGVRLNFYFAPGYGYYQVPRQYYGFRPQIGDYLPDVFLRYRVNSFDFYGLPYPPAGTAWVYVDNAIVLVDLYDGYIIDVVYDAWRW